MSTDTKTVPVTSNGSLLETFGKYYRNRKSGNSAELLNNVFEEAERKINPVNIARSRNIFEINNNIVTPEKSKIIPFVTNGAKKTQILKQAAAKPKPLNVLKTIHKLGKRGGYAALAIGAAVGLCILYKTYSDNSEKTV